MTEEHKYRRLCFCCTLHAANPPRVAIDFLRGIMSNCRRVRAFCPEIFISSLVKQSTRNFLMGSGESSTSPSSPLSCSRTCSINQ